jgi:hypothetical protein
MEFMSMETWIDAWNVMNEVSPTSRVDVCLLGESTLHKDLVEFVSVARKLCPLAQIQITNNGTTLLKGDLLMEDLLDAGANVVYVDMYGPRETFKKMAASSGYPWYEYYNKPDGAPSPWTYLSPDLKLVVLQVHPGNWPESRKKSGLLGTWFNNLDWDAAKKFGLKPVVDPPARRCNQPFICVPVHVSGQYLLCCQDGMAESAGKFGRVQDGVEGFKRYWYGKDIQIIRRRLRLKNRADTSECSRCDITFSRCDYVLWEDDEVERWWDGKEWHLLEHDPSAGRFMVKSDRKKQAGFGF